MCGTPEKRKGYQSSTRDVREVVKSGLAKRMGGSKDKRKITSDVRNYGDRGSPFGLSPLYEWKLAIERQQAESKAIPENT